jgi:sialate O-acetylesterase
MKILKLLVVSLLLPISSLVPCAEAGVQLPAHFSDHMVLQREMKVPIWGTAESGESVTVEFAGKRETTKAGADGKWRLDLPPLATSAQGQVLTVTGSAKSDAVKLNDVLVGEVWLCSGQSNMDFTVAKTPKYYFAGVNNEAEEVAAANYPTIRMFTAAWALKATPQTDVAGTWKLCNPENVREFSAVGYFFARSLAKDLNVPIGIITCTFGASTAEAWIRREALEANEALKPLLTKFDASVEAFQSGPGREKFDEAMKKWDADAAKATAEGKPAPKKPKNPDPVQDQHNPTVMFNGMIAPVIPTAIRGVLWYQGESIVGSPDQYSLVQATLIEDWRGLWKQGNFPFYLVQLAANKPAPVEPGNSNVARVREQQAKALSLPNTGMAVTIDIGDAKNIHPKNKQDVGARLARIALAKTYGKAVVDSGPAYESMKIEGAAVRLIFKKQVGGLVAKDGPLKQFAIAGADRKFVWADAKIDGDTVVVSSPQVSEPAAVRYAWADNPEGCNLYNAEGLPAAPFRTDDWR